jgi:hypothetical protein
MKGSKDLDDGICVHSCVSTATRPQILPIRLGESASCVQPPQFNDPFIKHSSLKKVIGEGSHRAQIFYQN